MGVKRVGGYPLDPDHRRLLMGARRPYERILQHLRDAN